MEKISIVTPVLNQGRYLSEAIESVMAQDDPCFEHIVIDGGSTDQTLDVLKQYPHLRWISEQDDGQSDAVNKGFQMATGTIFGEINADDYYERKAFAAVRRAFADPDVHAVAGGCHFVDAGGQFLNTWPGRGLTHEDAFRFLQRPIPHPSVFYRSWLWKKVGGLATGVRFAPDLDLWLRLTQHANIRPVPEILATFRFNECSNSGTVPLSGKVGALYHLARHGCDMELFEEMYRFVSDWENQHMRPQGDCPGLAAELQKFRDFLPGFLERFVCLLWGSLGGQRVALFGAGKHTAWLLETVKGEKGPMPVAILDDWPREDCAYEMPCMRPQHLDEKDVDAVVLSSDAHERALLQRARELWDERVRIIPIYNHPAVPVIAKRRGPV